MTQDDFYKQEKETRAEAVAELHKLKTVFKTINDFEAKHPPKNKDPTDKIFLKKKLEDLFKNMEITN